MARVAILDHSQTFAEAVAEPLRQLGHEVLTAVTASDFEPIAGFVPQVIVAALTSIGEPRPVDPAMAEPSGYQTLVALEDQPELVAVPRIVLGNGIQESDVPSQVSYDCFLTLPVDAERLAAKVAELAGRVRTRHKLSDYFCPQCHARLVCVYGPHDLFCLRCGTAVTIEGDECDALTVSGRRIPCSLELLRLPTRQGPD